jgi:hypothetical protein
MTNLPAHIAVPVASAIILGVLCPSVVGAQEPPGEARVVDPIELDSSSTARTKCYLHERYIVVERELIDEVGADLFVRARRSGRCDADSLPGDIVIRNDWAEYFAGLRGDVLIIDSGTGPDLRGLIVIDLRTHQRLLERSYVELVAGPDTTSIGIWDGFYLDRPAPGCKPPVGGLEPGIDSLFTLDLRTGDVRYAGRTRCANRQ